MDLATHEMWLHFLVGCLFTGLIVFGPLLALIVYPIVVCGGTWTTFFRKTYELPDYRAHPPAPNLPQPHPTS